MERGGRQPADWTVFAVHPALFHDAGRVVTVEGRYVAEHASTGRTLHSTVTHAMGPPGGQAWRYLEGADDVVLEDPDGNLSSAVQNER